MRKKAVIEDLNNKLNTITSKIEEGIQICHSKAEELKKFTEKTFTDKSIKKKK